jgi:hypothetical protein
MDPTIRRQEPELKERIKLDEPESLEAWARKLDATPRQLREAVAAVGDRAADVELHLKGSRSTMNAERELGSER